MIINRISKLFFLLLFLFLFLGLCIVTCSRHDAVEPPTNAEEFIQIIIDRFDTEGQNGAWTAYVLSSPLSESDQVSPAVTEEDAKSAASSFTPDGDYWFSYIDEDPFAQFAHTVRYFYIDADSGVVTEEESQWWPEINGQALFASGHDLRKVYAPVPDDGNVPLSYDIFDSSDSEDEIDEPVYIQIYPNYDAQKVTIKFLVSIPSGGKTVNIVIDHNHDGQWAKNEVGKEWLVENFKASDSGGWLWTDETDLPLNENNKFGYEAWVRVGISDSEISASDDGWDGSGDFDKVMDSLFNFLPWGGPGYDSDDLQTDAIGPEEPDFTDPGDILISLGDIKVAGTGTYKCETDGIEIPIERKVLVMNLGDSPGNSWMMRDAGRAWLWFEMILGKGSTTLLQRPDKTQTMAALDSFLNGIKCLDELYIYVIGHGGQITGSIHIVNGDTWLSPKEVKAKIDALSHCPSSMNYYANECRQPGYCNLNMILLSCFSGFWVTPPTDCNRPGVNILTAASAFVESWASRKTLHYVSSAFWDGYTGLPGQQKADQTPYGNGDGKVTPDEAMRYAKFTYGGPRSNPQTHTNADCNCECDSELVWIWEDPEEDLIYWHTVGTPIYVGSLDIVQHGVRSINGGQEVQNGSAEGEWFEAFMSFAEDLPSSSDSGFREYYTVFDAHDDWPNYTEEGPTFSGDTAYIAQFLDGNWTMFLFQFLPGQGWTMRSTTSTVAVNGKDLVMRIESAESGVDVTESWRPVYNATWYLEKGSTDAGDVTDTH
jgi:hypothetical protein